MPKSFEGQPWESVEQTLSEIESVTEHEAEGTIEREMMTKARQLFDYPETCSDRHRLPDTVEDLTLVVEKISYLIDKDDPNKPLLTYRRLYIKRDGAEELDLDSQVLEYTEWSEEVPIEIMLPNHFPESESDPEIVMNKVGKLLDRHLAELLKPQDIN